jgi:hypothetical protein
VIGGGPDQLPYVNPNEARIYFQAKKRILLKEIRLSIQDDVAEGRLMWISHYIFVYDYYIFGFCFLADLACRAWIARELFENVVITTV